MRFMVVPYAKKIEWAMNILGDAHLFPVVYREGARQKGDIQGFCNPADTLTMGAILRLKSKEG